MCEYNVEESNREKGKDQSVLSSVTTGFDDLINPFQQRTGLGLLLHNLSPRSWDTDDSKSTPELDTTITPTKVTNLAARQGEIDPRLKKKKRNLNSLRIREDLPQQTLTSPVDSQSTGTTNILI